MARFRRKPDTLAPIEANQYVKRGCLPLGLRSREDGSVYVNTIQDRDVDVSLGEWIIEEPDGIHYYPCSDEVFRARYERIDP